MCVRKGRGDTVLQRVEKQIPNAPAGVSDVPALPTAQQKGTRLDSLPSFGTSP